MRLEKKLKEISTERKEFEHMVFEKVKMKLDKEIFERVGDVLVG